MKADIMKGRYRPESSIRNSGWKRIPAVKQFRVYSSEFYNSLLKEAGLERKMEPEIQVKLNKLERMNRYIEHQVIRLEKSRANPRLYWTIAWYCIRNSKAFRISAYNRVFPSWWHSKPTKQVAIELNQIDRSIKGWHNELKIQRVYIPKQNGKMRPLGVPSPIWRVVGHMWSNMLTFYLREELDFNHAYQPGKGTLSCWKELITKVIPSKNIYEFDLKGFFDNVRIEKVSRTLHRLGVPRFIVEHIERMNKSAPILTSEELTDENKWKLRNKYNNLYYPNILEEKIDENKLYEAIMEPSDFSNEIVEANTGLPQGFNTSPILSLITLIDWKKNLEYEGIKLLMYADDGILYSDKSFDPVFLPEIEGITMNEEKSSWIREEGYWEKEKFKFLGLEYDAKKDILKGSTRNGSELEFQPKQEKIFDILRQLKLEYPDWFKLNSEDSRLKYLSESTLLGLVQSKLYQGTWEVPKWEEKEWKMDPNSWYGRSIDCKGSPTMSSLAIEWLADIYDRVESRWVEPPFNNPVKHYDDKSKLDDLASNIWAGIMLMWKYSQATELKKVG